MQHTVTNYHCNIGQGLDRGSNQIFVQLTTHRRILGCALCHRQLTGMVGEEPAMCTLPGVEHRCCTSLLSVDWRAFQGMPWGRT